MRINSFLLKSFSAFFSIVLKGIQASKAPVFYERIFVFLTFFWIPLAVSPLTRDNFTVIKWKIVHLLAAFALFQLFFVHKKVKFPELNLSTVFIFLGILGLWGFEYFFHSIPLFSEITADRIAFLGLVIFFYQLFKKDPKTLDWIGFALIASMITFVFSIFYTKTLLWSDCLDIFSVSTRKKIQYTFGNENMAAQFIGLAVIATFRQVFVSRQIFAKILFGTSFIIFVLFLVATACRSVLMGAVFGITLYGIFQLPPLYRRRTILSLCLISIPAAFLLFSARFETSHHRLDMWKNTIHMVQDYPLGVGRGKFNFYHVLYQEQGQQSPRSETLIERTPHNEFLKYLAEEGWLFIGLVLLLTTLLLKQGGRAIFVSLKQKEKTQFAGGIFLLLLAEGFVQFPFEVALPFLSIATIVGYFLSIFPRSRELSIPLLFSVPFFIFFSTIGAFLWVANLGHGAKRFDPLFTRLGCSLAPYEWRTCDQYMQKLVIEKHYPELLQYTLEQLELRPYNFPALFQRGYAYVQMGDMGNACKISWFYDRLFDHKSRLSGFVAKHCPKEDQEAFLTLPLRDHYKTLFTELPESLGYKAIRNA